MLHNCSYCDYQSPYKSNLRRHLRTKHSALFTHNVSISNEKERNINILTEMDKNKEETDPKLILPNLPNMVLGEEEKNRSMKSTNNVLNDNVKEAVKKETEASMGRVETEQEQHLWKNKVKRYSCNECNFQCKDKSNLRRHVRAKHGGVRYTCNQCQFVAVYRSTLKMHVKSKH